MLSFTLTRKNEPAREKGVFTTQATSKGSGETAQKRSLARAFAVRRPLRSFEQKRMSVAQIVDCSCAFEEPQNGKQ